MKFYVANRRIDASPETVWSVLADTAAYPSWDSGVIGVEGTPELGAKIAVRSEVDPKRAFKVKVTTFDAPRTMVWSGGMPLGLFTGVRTFSLSPTADGGTDFGMREQFSGPMLGPIWRSMPNLQPSFDRFADGLKATAEARA